MQLHMSHIGLVERHHIQADPVRGKKFRSTVNTIFDCTVLPSYVPLSLAGTWSIKFIK
jgi:hypothetical protein